MVRYPTEKLFRSELINSEKLAIPYFIHNFNNWNEFDSRSVYKDSETYTRANLVKSTKLGDYVDQIKSFKYQNSAVVLRFNLKNLNGSEGYILIRIKNGVDYTIFDPFRTWAKQMNDYKRKISGILTGKVSDSLDTTLAHIISNIGGLERVIEFQSVHLNQKPMGMLIGDDIDPSSLMNENVDDSSSSDIINAPIGDQIGAKRKDCVDEQIVLDDTNIAFVNEPTITMPTDLSPPIKLPSKGSVSSSSKKKKHTKTPSQTEADYDKWE